MNSNENITNKNTITFIIQKQNAVAHIWPIGTCVELFKSNTPYGYNKICNYTGKIIDTFHDLCGIEYQYNHHYKTYYPV
jgi:hypothetical protein